MTTKVLQVSTWGRSGLGTIEVTVDSEEFDGELEAVKREVAQLTGLVVVTCRGDGTSLDRRGRPESRHFQMTLGRELSKRLGGGYSVEGEAAIPVGN